MPELPEVTTVSNRLNTLLVGKRIVSVEVVTAKLIKGVSPLKLSKYLTDRVIKRIYNIGKFMVWEFSDQGPYLLSHMRMDGRYHLSYPGEVDYVANTRLIFNLDDDSRLIYIDTRGFGTFELREQQDLLALPPISLLAKTPEDISFSELAARFSRSRRAIKTLLLDQHCILGLGNIYADEVLFASKILPTRLAASLKDREVRSILKNARRILAEAIRFGGSSVHSFYVLNDEIGGYQGRLKVYSRARKACFNCNNPIEKIKLNGRGTHFCSRCQR